MRKPLRHISSPTRGDAARPHALRCGGCSAVRSLRLGSVSVGLRGHVLCIHTYTEAAMWVVRALGRPDMEGKQDAASVSFCSGCWPLRSTPKKLSPLEAGLRCQPIIFWVGGAGPINLRPVFSDTNRANRTGQPIITKEIVRRNYFCAGAAVRGVRILYCLIVGVTTSVPVFSMPRHAADDEAPRRCWFGDGSRVVRSSGLFPETASVHSGVSLNNFKFGLVIVPASGPAASHPAARLWLSHPLTSAGAGKFSFMVSSFPEPERWCWTTTVPGTGFLGFTSSASGGAIDIRTDAAMTVDSSNCVKLRKPVASVHHSPVPCKIRTAQRQAVYWGKTWAGDFSMWALGVALRSGNFCDATQRRSVHIFETNVPVSSVTSFCDVRFFCTDDRNTASVSFCKFWQGVSGSSHDVPGRLFVQKHLLAGGPCERTISLRVLSADSRKDRCRRTLEPKFCNAYKFLV